MTVGTRISPRTVCTASSCSRIGRVIHSSQVTGRMWFSPSMSRPVATLVAIMQNASCGVRTLIACQLRFSTSTVALVNMLHQIQILAVFGSRCLFFVEMGNWLPRLVLLQVSPGFRDRRAPDYTTRQMVAREGAAPPISGCRPAVILFHHRAEKNWLPGLGSHQHSRLQRAVSY